MEAGSSPVAGIDARTMPDEISALLSPGPLVTSVHAAAVPVGYAQSLINCSTDRGVWEVDQRFRQCQPAPAASPGGFVFGSAKAGKEILAVHNGTARKLTAAAVDAVDGSVSQWSAALVNGTGLGSGAWKGWQYQKWLFIANPDVGVRFMEIGTTLLEKLYINYDLNASGNVSLAIPPYPTYPFAGGDTVAQGANNSGGDFTITNNGVQMFDPWDPSGYQLTRQEFIVTFAASQDWSKVDYIHLTATMLQGNYFGDVPTQFRICNAAHATQATSIGAITRRKLSNANRAMDIWVDLTQIAEAERTAVTKIIVQLHLWRDGPDGFHVKPLDLGGIFLQSFLGTRIDTMTPATAPDVDYAYSYEVGGSETGATVVTLPGNNSLGDRYHPDLPYLGSHSKVTVVPFLDPPYNGVGAKVRFYRKVDALWYRIDDNSVLNTGTPSWTDKRTADEVKALGSPVTLTIGGIDPSASGPVTGIDFGIQYGGSNVYFGGGKAFWSRANNFKDVLWDQIISDNAADGDVGRPRTFLADPVFGQKVIAAVAGDALYMFARTASSYSNGTIASEASLPGVLPIRGVVGPGAACEYRGGALAASDDALWFVRVASGQSTAAPSLEELTETVRPTYAAVIGSLTARAGVQVGVWEDQVWVICENRYLHLSRERRWIYGEFGGGRTIVGVQTNTEYGLIFLLSDGALGKVGAFTTDGGTNSAGSNGAAVTWTWRSRRELQAINVLSAQVKYTGTGTCNIQVKAISERNPSGTALTFADASKSVGFEVYPRDSAHAVNGGRWMEIELSGKSTDLVYSAFVKTAKAEDRFVQT